MEKLEDGCSQVEVMSTLDLDIETMKKLLEDYKTLQSYTKEKKKPKRMKNLFIPTLISGFLTVLYSLIIPGEKSKT
ncbi:MAG: hypothetical protein ACKD6O_02120 [Candidatus Bathyarchaeota archaeon]